MSHYAVIETEIRNEAELVEALERLNPAWKGKIERRATAVHLFGYHGDQREDVAHVVIRRQYIGPASNDIGFVRGEDGKYRAIISEFDSRTYDAEWLGRLKQRYGIAVATHALRARGVRAIREETMADGKIRLIAEV